MKLINASFEILNPSEDFKKDIELIARTCYKSENKITDDSADSFINRVLISKKHLAMCEHGTIYLKVPSYDIETSLFYLHNKFSVVKSCEKDNYDYITTNYRVLLDNNRLKDLKYKVDITDYHERRVSVKFITDIGVGKEFCRNRGEQGTGFAQESTRYCNYMKEKFGFSVTFIRPQWVDSKMIYQFDNDLKIIEGIYFKWLKLGWTPEQARGFLPQFTKTELWMTATIHDWCHFLFLRADKSAHPQAQELAYPLKNEFIKRGWLTEKDIHY